MEFKKLLITTIFITSSIGCSSSSNTSNPSTVMKQFNTAMTSAGTQLQSSGLSSALIKGLSSVNFVESVGTLCDEHAEPLNGSSMMSQSDARYPGRVFYCKIAKNTGSDDSVPGAYEFIQDMSCALENAGIVYDGADHSATVHVDSTCFSPAQLDGDGPATMTITYNASQPATFNSNFQTGIVMTVPDFGQFTLATSVNGSTIEFLGYENQEALHPGKTGVYVGQFNSDTKEIRFEARHDRYHCTEAGSCGFSRHDRLYLKCTSVSAKGECVDIAEIHGASSDINSGNGQISTISGNFSEGVKARFFAINSSNYNDPTAWLETTNVDCYNASSDTGGDCSSNAGIGLPASTFHFPLYTGHVANSAWYTTAGNLDFTTVSMDSDVP